MTLPRKPSALVRVALRDLRRAEADERYQICMGTWHQAQILSPCTVCLAGAVMAFSLRVPIDKDSYPDKFPPGLRNKLNALDEFRCGRIAAGLEHLGLAENWLGPSFVMVRQYICGRDAFYEDMASLARVLEEGGL